VKEEVKEKQRPNHLYSKCGYGEKGGVPASERSRGETMRPLKTNEGFRKPNFYLIPVREGWERGGKGRPGPGVLFLPRQSADHGRNQDRLLGPDADGSDGPELPRGKGHRVLCMLCHITGRRVKNNATGIWIQPAGKEKAVVVEAYAKKSNQWKKG